jgi:hypothetical protein
MSRTRPADARFPRRSRWLSLLGRAAGAVYLVFVTAGAGAAAAVDFGADVVPALTKAGCNSGACHGTPSGKNGFRLSLRGYLPDQDFLSLTRDMAGRRVNRLRPAESLILMKGTGAVAHEGGVRFPRGSYLYRIIQDWIAAGALPAGAARPRLAHLEVSARPERQLAVTAVFADGSRRDVTALARYSVNDAETAAVTDAGWVRFRKAGEVAVLAGYLSEVAAVRLLWVPDVPGFRWQAPAEQNFIDRHVFAKLHRLRIRPAPLCTDEEFVRRATLDVCGVLPEPARMRRFLADRAPDKRARLIDELLARPEHADFWALKWVDRLGCNNRFVGRRGAYAYRQWIFARVNANVPFNRFVREVITAAGPNYSHPAAGFYRRVRDPQSRVEAVSQLFLGVRIGCARCHNHPAERWTQDDYYGLAAFFSRVRYRSGPYFNHIYDREETVWLDRRGEVVHPRTGRVMKPKLLGGAVVDVPDYRDRRAVLAEWITRPDNPFFARAAVNRLWLHLFGRGIVEPVDDFRESNPPCNPELLDALAADFVAHRFNVRHMLQVILNSATYQLSAATDRFNENDEVYFSHCRVRQLSAEQLMDAICQVTGVPERYTGVPLGTRAAQLPDGELFHPFLKAFGRPARAIECECERDNDATLEQALLLEAGRVIHEKLKSEHGSAAKLARSAARPEELAETLFLKTLCRRPSAAERRLVAKRLTAGADRRPAVEDVLWALLNHREFLFQH